MDLTYLVQGDKPLYPDTLFALTPGPATRAHPVLIGGHPGNFAALSALYEVLTSLSLSTRLIVPGAIVKTGHLPPATLTLPAPKDRAGLVALEAALQTSSVLIAGPDMRVGSDVQIVLEHIVRSERQPILVTDELLPLFRITPSLLALPTVVPVISTVTLLKLMNATHSRVKLQPGRGVYNVGEVLAALPSGHPIAVAHDAERLYILIRDQQTIVHGAYPAGLRAVELHRALLTALLLTVFARGRSGSLVACAAAAIYLVSQTKAGQSLHDQARSIQAPLL